MTACCCSGYRPLRGIRLDECNWPPRLAPAGPWEICNCPEGAELKDRLAAMSAREVSGIMAPIAEAVATLVAGDQKQPNPKTAPICQPPPTCSTCPTTDVKAKIIEWHEHWHTWMCPECGAVLAEEEEKP